jgi:hypothetical protein
MIEREMAVGVLEEVKTIESARAMLAACRGILPKLGRELEIAHEVVSGVNLLLSFGSSMSLTESEREEFRIFLHKYLDKVRDEPHIATAYCALRTVGNEASIELILSRPQLHHPWEGTERLVIKGIEKSQRRASKQK